MKNTIKNTIDTYFTNSFITSADDMKTLLERTMPDNLSRGTSVSIMTICEDLANSDQSWDYTLIQRIQLNNRLECPIKITIRCHACDNQSHVRGYSFDGYEWKLLVEIPFTCALACFRMSYVTKNADIALFRNDASIAIKRLAAIMA